MRRLSVLAFGLGLLLLSFPAAAQDKLVVSIWGGSWNDLVGETVAKKFTAETGVDVEFITGGTIDRLNKAKLAKGNPESDLTFTTSHVGWLYANDGLYEQLDLAKIPNAQTWSSRPRSAPITSAPGPMSTPSAIAPTCCRPASIRELGRSVEARAEGQAFRAGFRSEPPHRRFGSAVGRRCGAMGEGAGQAQGS